jgi:hypothetical protein
MVPKEVRKNLIYTRTLHNNIRQFKKNKYQKIKSRNTKVVSVSSISFIKTRSSFTLAQLSEMCEKRKARLAQVTQSQHDLTCTNEMK